MSKTRNRTNKVSNQTQTSPQTGDQVEAQKNTSTTTAPKGDNDEVVQEEPALETQHKDTTQESKEEPKIVVGSLVGGTSAPLGNAVTEEKAKEIIEQKPVAAQPVLSKFQKKIEEIKQSGSAIEKSIVTTLESYVKTLAPGVLNEETIIHRNQLQLWNIIKGTLENEEEFDNNWKLLIMFFREYREGALGGSYPFRGLDNIKGISAEQIKAFMNVLNLLTISAGLNNKKDVSKFTRLDKSIHSIFKESVRQRVINYYV